MTSPSCGPWVLEQRLGHGASAEVWRARHRQQPDWRAALKFFTGPLSQHRDFRLRLDAEIRSTAGIEHPSVVALHGTRESDRGTPWLDAGTPVLVMELWDGGAVATRPCPPWSTLRSWIEQWLGALAHLHARGVLHLDLKPANLLIDRSGARVALGDLGMARSLRAGPQGVIGGTPASMPPEQLRADHRALSPPTDLFALGASLWRIISGQWPFGRSPDEVLAAHALPLPPLLPHVAVPRGLHAWLATLLARTPRHRPPHAAAASALLHSLLSSRGPHLPATPAPRGCSTAAGTKQPPSSAAHSTWLSSLVSVPAHSGPAAPTSGPPTSGPPAPIALPSQAPASPDSAPPTPAPTPALPDWRRPVAELSGRPLARAGQRVRSTAPSPRLWRFRPPDEHSRAEDVDALWVHLAQSHTRPRAVILSPDELADGAALRRQVAVCAAERGRGLPLRTSPERGSLWSRARSGLRLTLGLGPAEAPPPGWAAAPGASPDTAALWRRWLREDSALRPAEQGLALRGLLAALARAAGHPLAIFDAGPIDPEEIGDLARLIAGDAPLLVLAGLEQAPEDTSTWPDGVYPLPLRPLSAESLARRFERVRPLEAAQQAALFQSSGGWPGRARTLLERCAHVPKHAAPTQDPAGGAAEGPAPDLVHTLELAAALGPWLPPARAQLLPDRGRLRALAAGWLQPQPDGALWLARPTQPSPAVAAEAAALLAAMAGVAQRGRVAALWARAGQPERALPLWLEEATRCRVRSELRRARDHLEQAQQMATELGLDAAHPQRVQITLERLFLLRLTGRHQEARALLQATEPLPLAPKQQLALLRERGRLQQAAGQTGPSVSTFRAALDQARALAAPRLVISLSSLLAGALRLRGRFDEAEALFRELAQLPDDQVHHRDAHAELGEIAIARGQLEQAGLHLQHAHRAALRAGALWSVANLEALLGDLARARQQWPESAAHYREAARRFAALGSRLDALMQAFHLGLLAVQTGDWDNARSRFRPLAEAARSGPAWLDQVATTGLLAVAAHERAHRRVDELLARAERAAETGLLHPDLGTLLHAAATALPPDDDRVERLRRLAARHHPSPHLSP